MKGWIVSFLMDGKEGMVLVEYQHWHLWLAETLVMNPQTRLALLSVIPIEAPSDDGALADLEALVRSFRNRGSSR